MGPTIDSVNSKTGWIYLKEAELADINNLGPLTKISHTFLVKLFSKGLFKKETPCIQMVTQA